MAASTTCQVVNPDWANYIKTRNESSIVMMLNKDSETNLLNTCFTYVEDFRTMGERYLTFVAIHYGTNVYPDGKTLYYKLKNRFIKFIESDMSGDELNRFLEDSFPLLEEYEKLVNYLIKEFMRVAVQ